MFQLQTEMLTIANLLTAAARLRHEKYAEIRHQTYEVLETMFTRIAERTNWETQFMYDIFHALTMKSRRGQKMLANRQTSRRKHAFLQCVDQLSKEGAKSANWIVVHAIVNNVIPTTLMHRNIAILEKQLAQRNTS